MNSLRYPSSVCDNYLRAQSSVTRWYQSSHRTTITAAQRRLTGTASSPRFWVPAAYRGGKVTKKEYEDRGGGAKRLSFRDPKNRHEKGRIAHYKPKGKQNKEEVVVQPTQNVDLEKKRLLESCNNLVALSRQYRDHLARDSQSTIDITVSNPLDGKNFNSLTSIKVLTKQLKHSLNDIHSTETTLTWNNIMETELMFRDISTALQNTITLSACLTKDEKSSTKRAEYADLAEFALCHLLSLRSERSLLVNSVRNWSSKVAPSYQRKSNKSVSIKAWVATLFETNGGDVSDLESESKSSGLFVHEDPSLGVSNNMFHEVMESIVLTIPGFKLDTMTLESHQSSPEVMDEVSDRLVNLLDMLPSTSSEHSELFAFVMKFFGSVGTLDSARNSFDYYRRHNHVIPFSLVLSAYCEAAKREEDDVISRTIADECLNLVQQEWDNELSGQLVDGVSHLCLALECLFTTKGGLDTDLGDQVEALAVQILSKEKYDEILNATEAYPLNIQTEESTLRLLDGLVKILASCQDKDRIRKSRKLLDVLIRYDGWNGVTPTFPSTGACNQLLDALCWLHQEHFKEMCEDERKGDLDYVLQLLNFMQTSGKTSCWPNDSTFLSIFRMLSVVGPDDIGEQAETLLSRMEMRNPNHPSEPTCVSLAMYHRVFGCWVESANKKVSSGKAFQRSMYLLEQMEIQSMSLLMTEKEIRVAAIKSLYHPELQPTVRTYKLILGIFQSEAKNLGYVSEDSERLLFALCESMKLRGILNNEPSIRKRLESCIGLIIRDSEEKQRIYNLLEDLEC